MLLGKSKFRYAFFVACILTFLLSILGLLFSNSDVHDDFNGSSLEHRLQAPTSSSSTGTSTVPPKRSKVFVIGLSKTGTTSFGDALARLRYRRLGWEDIRSRFLFRSYLRGDISPFTSLTEYYDAFEDLPWALIYQDMARIYPDAKFILTLRANEEDWLTSIKTHTANRKWVGHKFVYGAFKAAGHEESYLEAYQNHTASVRNFFAAKENGPELLEWVTDSKDAEEDKWGSLLRFLDLEDSKEIREELGEFPWTNRTDFGREKIFMKTVWWIWDLIMYYLEEGSLRILEYSGWLTGRMG